MAYTTRSSLLERLRDGGSVPWQEFAAAYGPLIAWAAGRTGLSGPEVEDCVQEVLLELFEGRRDFVYDRSRGRFRDYLYTVTVRKALKVMRRRRRQEVQVETMPEPADEDPGDAAWEEQWRQHVFRQALARVRGQVEPKTFQAFEMYELQGLPVREVAAFLEVSESAVYVYKKRVVDRLKAAVRELSTE
jgi:RNA polymerase sigma factor (sigma-70 family)